MNEDNLNQIKVGDILKKGTKLLMEGTDGLATGNHFHITANLGKYYGFLQNSNGAWCFTYEKSLKPTEAFYCDTEYTKIINLSNYDFKIKSREITKIGLPIIKNTKVDQIEIITDDVYCYESPTLNSKILGVIKKGFYEYNTKVELEGVAWYNIGIGWVLYNNEQTILYYKDKTLPKVKKDNILLKIIKWIINIFK